MESSNNFGARFFCLTLQQNIIKNTGAYKSLVVRKGLIATVLKHRFSLGKAQVGVACNQALHSKQVVSFPVLANSSADYLQELPEKKSDLQQHFSENGRLCGIIIFKIIKPILGPEYLTCGFAIRLS